MTYGSQGNTSHSVILIVLTINVEVIKFKPTKNVKVTVKDKRVNSGGGYGLKFPRKYTFEGDSFSITWLKNKLAKRNFK